MADSMQVLSNESMLSCLAQKTGCLVNIGNVFEVSKDYKDYSGTRIGNIRPTRVKVTGFMRWNGGIYIQFQIPADTVNNNWDRTSSVWYQIGYYDPYGDHLTTTCYIVTSDANSSGKLDQNNNAYLESVKDTAKIEKITAPNQTAASLNGYLVNADGKINTSAISNVQNFSTALNNYYHTGSTGSTDNISVINADSYTVEDYWIFNPTSEVEDYQNSVKAMTDLNKLRYIFGLPYQFLPSADMRIEPDKIDNDEIFGYTYAEKIGSRLPLLYITPGNSKFLSDSTSKERKSAISNILDTLTLSGDSGLNDLLDGYSGKLYSLQPAYNEYFQYVNPMCRIGAVLLGLDSRGNDVTKAVSEDEEYRKLDGVWCCDYNWAFADNSGAEDSFDNGDSSNTPFAKVKEFFTDTISWLYYRQVIPFYITSEPQFQDVFNNETTESSLASKVNGFSDSAREMQFLLGTTSSAIAENFDALGDVFANSRQAIEEFSAKLAGNGGIFSSLLGNLKTVATGGRLMFPNIWSNSSYNKSYNITTKLTTPYYDVKSWWLNIYVPLCHCLGFVMPRGEYHNGYSAPFLVKAFYKGTFNIDMGIITEMTIQKGKEGGWTKDGLPTVVDVSFTIQDLYSSISMSSITLMKANTLENIQEMDYLCSLCGININEPDLTRIVRLYVTLNLTSRFNPTEVLFGLTSKLEETITPKISSIFTLL